MIETRGNWAYEIGGVNLEIMDYADQGDREYTPGIFNILKADSGTNLGQKNFAGKTGFSSLTKTEEGGPYADVERDSTYLTQMSYTKYTGAVEMTDELIADNNFKSQLNAMKDLTKSANYDQDKSGLQLFNGGFATTTKVNGFEMSWYGDAVPLFSTVHPTLSAFGSTQSNASATSIAFGHDNLFTAKVALMKQNTDNGKATMATGKIMIVAPIELEKTIEEEMGSTLTPENANNAINVFRGSMDVATSLHISSTTAWFLLRQGDHELYHDVREGTTLEQSRTAKSGTTTYTVSARWAESVRGWQNTWGSKGTLAAYSS
jgi:hypothetical protein